MGSLLGSKSSSQKLLERDKSPAIHHRKIQILLFDIVSDAIFTFFSFFVGIL